MNTLTGEPILDWAMNMGIAGLCLFLMFRVLIKQLDKKGSGTTIMLNASKALEAISARQSHQETLIKHIMDTQTHQYEAQNQMLRLMERQMVLLEQFGDHIHESAGTLQSIRDDMLILKTKLDTAPGPAISRKRPG